MYNKHYFRYSDIKHCYQDNQNRLQFLHLDLFLSTFEPNSTNLHNTYLNRSSWTNKLCTFKQHTKSNCKTTCFSCYLKIDPLTKRKITKLLLCYVDKNFSTFNFVSSTSHGLIPLSSLTYSAQNFQSNFGQTNYKIILANTMFPNQQTNNMKNVLVQLEFYISILAINL